MISAKQARAVSALLVERNVTAASKAAGVSLRSLQRWLKDDEFTGALVVQQSELIRSSLRLLTGDMQANLDLMRRIRDDEYLPATVRLKAAMALDASHRAWREHFQFEERLSALERAVDYGTR